MALAATRFHVPNCNYHYIAMSVTADRRTAKAGHTPRDMGPVVLKMPARPDLPSDLRYLRARLTSELGRRSRHDLSSLRNYVAFPTTTSGTVAALASIRAPTFLRKTQGGRQARES